MNFLTPLRYPGGKARLGPWLAYTLRKNQISGGTYLEAYAGGAGAALYLLNNGYVNKIVINDLDPMVHAFWHCVLNQNDALVKKIEKVPLTLAEWHKQRKVLDAGCDASPLELATACFYLNRTNRSGILRGGVIGGINQDGPYLIDARFNKAELVYRIKRIGAQRSRIALHNLDAIEFLQVIKPKLNARSLLYLDPPYYIKGRQLYRNHYGPADHAVIARQVMRFKTPWLVTYDNAEPIRQLYVKADSCTFGLRYSTHLARPQASELMFYGNFEIDRQPTLVRSGGAYPRQWDRVAA